MLDAGCWILDTGYWLCGIGVWEEKVIMKLDTLIDLLDNFRKLDIERAELMKLPAAEQRGILKQG